MNAKRLWILSIAVLCLSAGAAQAEIAGLARHVQGGALPGSPDYAWWYGCSPTSAGMMMGYYDRNGYAGLGYSNLVAGGVAELSNFGNPGALANQTIASAGHIADFYVGGYGASGDDVSPPHHAFNSLADFMGTSQDSVGSSNGSTWFYSFTNGYPFHDYDAWNYGVWSADGMYGVGEYVGYAGYGVTNLYTQRTDNLGLTYGFTFDNYKDEIDQGRVVMLHVTGHSMFGYGYDPLTDEIILHDTWSPAGEERMPWGGSYSGMGLWGVTVVEVTGGEVVPVPAAALLGLLGLGTAGLRLRRYV